MADRNDEGDVASSSRGIRGVGVELHRLPKSPRFERSSGKSAKPFEQSARLLLLKLEWSVRWLLQRSGI